MVPARTDGHQCTDAVFRGVRQKTPNNVMIMEARGLRKKVCIRNGTSYSRLLSEHVEQMTGFASITVTSWTLRRIGHRNSCKISHNPGFRLHFNLTFEFNSRQEPRSFDQAELKNLPISDSSTVVFQSTVYTWISPCLCQLT